MRLRSAPALRKIGIEPTNQEAERTQTEQDRSCNSGMVAHDRVRAHRLNQDVTKCPDITLRSQRILSTAPDRLPATTSSTARASVGIASGQRSAATTATFPGTTGDHFRGAPPSRIMKSWLRRPLGNSHLARDKVRSAATRLETGAGGQKAADGQGQAARYRGVYGVRPGKSDQDYRTGVRVIEVSRSSTLDIE
jgi:hypothetical protein